MDIQNIISYVNNSNELKDLNAIKEAVEKRFSKLKKSQVSDARKKVIALADQLGISVDELMKQPEKKPLEPKYINPENSNETWVGRGKQPAWLSKKIEAGAKLEEFLI